VACETLCLACREMRGMFLASSPFVFVVYTPRQAAKVSSIVRYRLELAKTAMRAAGWDMAADGLRRI
jgi:hypothetical protein